jgi:hypothetical protein
VLRLLQCAGVLEEVWVVVHVERFEGIVLGMLKNKFSMSLQVVPDLVGAAGSGVSRLMLKIAGDVAGRRHCHVNARVARRNQDSRAPISCQLHATFMINFTLIERRKVTVLSRSFVQCYSTSVAFSVGPVAPVFRESISVYARLEHWRLLPTPQYCMELHVWPVSRWTGQIICVFL